jgi:endonuclease VIII-like 1
MPELAELRITANFINDFSKDLTFSRVEKSQVSKNLNFTVPFKSFKVLAESRGKELMLTLYTEKETLKVMMTMGMAGMFRLVHTGDEPKHSQLIFYSDPTLDGELYSLCYVDFRRFGKWKIAEGWSSNRGPDPTLQYDAFRQNVLLHLDRAIFNKPIHVALMDQRYFNGIGNYLRAEILHRLDIDPFQEARKAILENDPTIFEMCRDISKIAIKLNGGQLKDWKNPFGEDPKDFAEFIQCYSKPGMANIVDSLKRTFWYDPKWKLNQ